MLRVTLLLLVALLLPDLYIYHFYIRRYWRQYRLHRLYWLPTLVLIVVYLSYTYLTGPNALAHYPQPFGWLSIASLLVIVPKVLFMLVTLPAIGLRRHLPQWPFIGAGLILGAICMGGVIHGATEGRQHFDIKPVTYTSARLPRGFDGYRIAQISDLHVGSYANDKILTQLVQHVNALGADLIVFTGDLVNQRSTEVDRFVPVLSQLHAPDGVYSILGNHDYGDYYQWDSPQAEEANNRHLIAQQQAMGWRLLCNAHTLLYHGGDSIALIGVENDGEPPFSQHGDLPAATQGVDSLFSILLSHDPTHWRREVLPHSHIDLMLAGHTHGMQFVLFGKSPSSIMYPEWSGIYYEGPRALYVNVGIGYVGMPFRLGAWPEITLFTLRRAE